MSTALFVLRRFAWGLIYAALVVVTFVVVFALAPIAVVALLIGRGRR